MEGAETLPLLVKNMRRYSIDGVSLTLEELRSHLRVDYDHDNEQILRLGKTALSHIVNATRRSVEELVELNNGEFPEELKLAALELAAHWYRCPEPVSSIEQKAIPYMLDLLIKPFVRLGRREGDD